MPIHHRSYAKQHHPLQLSHLSWRLLQQFLIICGFGVFLPQILLLQGCGVNTDIIPRLSVSTSEQTLAPSQTVSLIVHGDKLKNSPINFTMSCAQSLCGTLAHDQYTAPSDISVPLAVAIKAVNLNFPEQSAATTLKVYPRPTIASVTPDHIVAGTSSTLVISGLGFVPGSSISISSPGTGSNPVVTNVVIGSLEAIAVNI